jgi:hypothetical protein
MKFKLLLLPLIALLLAGCSLVIGGRSGFIRTFAPTGGRGSVYYLGQQVRFVLTVSRPGYVTLVSLNPGGYSNVLVRNAYVPAGTTYFPRSPYVHYTITPPTGLQRVRAIFTTVVQRPNLALYGQYSFPGWQNRTDLYLQSYPVRVRALAQTYFYIQP